jgi:hypothetical protein
MLASLIFLNPFTMMFGAALISSPIIIHLINRMRFKRVRWAAMEFLLKAQKRSRRRMIIEQLILLLLRIALVLLFALLLGQLVQKKEPPPPSPNIEEKEAVKPTQHVILVDNTASMADLWREEGADAKEKEPFMVRARKTINDLVIKPILNDNHAHEVVLVRLSQPNEERAIPILTEQSQADVEKYLVETKARDHYDLAPALKKAKALFEGSPEKNHVLHLVSDFRAVDWNSSTVDALGQYFEHFEKAGVQVKLYDAAVPKRETDAAPANDNLAIVDVRPESRVVVKNSPVELAVTVTNFGGSDKRNVSVQVRVNNVERPEASVHFETIRPHETVTKRATLLFSVTAPKDLASKEDIKAKYDGFNVISAHIVTQDKGLTADNERYTVVEVRDKISLLLVDNDVTARTLVRSKGRDDYVLNKNAEAFYLWKLFAAENSEIDATVRTAAELEKFDLSSYSAVVLCNIPSLTPAAVDKLEAFLGAGGGVGFFMGPGIRDPKFYNDVLWKQGQGMFPAPLKEIANAKATPEQLNQIQTEQRFSLSKKLVIRNEMRRHPAMERLYTESRGSKLLDTRYESAFYGVSFPRYYVVDRPKWRPGDDTQVLLYLANYRSIGDFERQTKDLVDRLRNETDEEGQRKRILEQLAAEMVPAEKEKLQGKLDNLKAKMEKYTKFQSALKEYTTKINSLVSKYDTPLYQLVLWVDEVLLQDPGDPEKGRPSMIEFWQIPELAKLKEDFLQLVDVIKYGDPFYIAKQYKKGRVLAFMGAAGMSGPEGGYWNPLDSAVGQPYFPPLMKDSLQRYLCSNNPYVAAGNEAAAVAAPLAAVAGGAALSLVDDVRSDFYLPLGKPFLFRLATGPDAPDKIEVWHRANNDKPATGEDPLTFKTVPLKQKPVEGDIAWRFSEAHEPGVYLFGFMPKVIEGLKQEAKPDLRAVVYNFDTRLESDLERARTDDVLKATRVKQFEDQAGPLLDAVVERTDDQTLFNEDLGWSESPWLFLGMLIALILEQAWAVRLSFHVRNSAGPLPEQPFGRAPVVA